MAKKTQMTVGQLFKHLQMVLKNYPEVADKYIVVADDNEGNAYHGMFYGLTFKESEVKEVVEYSGVYDSQVDEPSELVILG
jgi:hypothetical protein